MTHICVGNLTIIGSDNGLSPSRRQAIIWTNAGILLFGPLATNFNDIFIEIHIFSFKKIHLKMSSGKLRPFCLGLNVLKYHQTVQKEKLRWRNMNVMRSPATTVCSSDYFSWLQQDIKSPTIRRFVNQFFQGNKKVRHDANVTPL